MKFKGIEMDSVMKFMSRYSGKFGMHGVRCFLSWASHQEGYNVTQCQVAFDTQICASHVSRAFKRLVDNNVLVVKGTVSNGYIKRRSKIYKLHPDVVKEVDLISKYGFDKRPMTSAEEIEEIFSKDTEAISKELSANPKMEIDHELYKMLDVEE